MRYDPVGLVAPIVVDAVTVVALADAVALDVAFAVALVQFAAQLRLT